MPCMGWPGCDMMDEPADKGPAPAAGLPDAGAAPGAGFFFLGFCLPSRFACRRASLRPQLICKKQREPSALSRSLAELTRYTSF